MRYIGVDGCRSGWLAIFRNGGALDHRLVAGVEELVNEFPEAERILIDVPIGLPWADAPVRPCDRMARQLLGNPRRSSVFPVPCRGALVLDDLDEASRINQRCIGRSIGAQTWGIRPKVHEVDRFLRGGGAGSRHIREIHPEVCFWALAGAKPMKHSKATAEGRAERLRVLQRYEPQMSLLLRDVLATSLRRDVKADDVLDAAVAFVTAEARDGKLDSLVGSPSHDTAGLPIEMLYLRPTPAMQPREMR